MKQTTEPLTFWQILWSTLAAAFGVQSRKNMERDFTHGEVMKFVIAGVSFTAIFVITMIFIVSQVLANL
ncbi:DUF2970 domain-containing protein [Reinekea sp.]|uniref:DUF2970 domain-containing protein n=1 Tax=Reinekea sp. TaxID=1970455 RepID=UPI002580AEFC|nr:DUF2970 domain-containing protein [Reinekea sp.]